MVESARSRKFLAEDDFHRFIDHLMKSGNLYAPVREDNNTVALRPIASAEQIETNFMQTSNNLRGIVEPQNEILLNFRDQLNPSIEERLPSENRKIVLWCRPCDARALSSLDDTFIDDKFPDPYYIRRRRSTLLIGLGCNRPFPFCFCRSVGGDPFGTDNLDILMTRTKRGYLAEAISARGGEMHDSLDNILTDPTPEDLNEADRIQNEAKGLLPREAPDPEELKARLKDRFEASFWKRWGDKCIGCGICTFLCPTCWCFDLTDLETHGKGYRIRTWDSCQFPLFTLHTSSHNPRPDKASRVRQRVLHKFSYHPTNFDGRIACVGCGRCSELCPEDIDLISILNDAMSGGDE